MTEEPTNMNPIKWINAGNEYRLTAGNEPFEALSLGIYAVRKTLSGFHLERRDGGFKMPPKIYGIEDSFIDRCALTFERTSGNIGIVLNGIRGTGKTVTAERIAEKIGLPIVLVEENFEGLPEFLAEIPHPATLLFDEFEKRFPDEQSQALLSIMDGTASTRHRRVFLLTTNNLRIDENFLQRPGRVRYVKTFSNLKRPSIEAIVDDCLMDTSRRSAVVNFIASLQLITVDIVTAIVEEINIHGEDPLQLIDLFNVKRMNRVFDVFEVEGNSEKLQQASVNAAPFNTMGETDTDGAVGEYFRIPGKNFGEITEFDGEFVSVTDSDDDGNAILKKFRILPVQQFNHGSFGKSFAGLNGLHP